MAKPSYSRSLAATVVLGLCGLGDAFLVGVPSVPGRGLAGRGRAKGSSAFTPSSSGSMGVCVDAAKRSTLRSPSTSFSSSTMLVPLSFMPPASSWKRNALGQKGSRRAVELSARPATGRRSTELDEKREGRERGQGPQWKGNGRNSFSRPAAVLRFVRESVERRAATTGKGMRARVAAWRRGMTVAFAGMAAALIVMTASSGSASAASSLGGSGRASPAFLGIGRPPAQKNVTPERMTQIPEAIYRHREELQEFCQSAPEDRLYDLNDLTNYEEALDELDMFGDKIAVNYGTREAMRLKYTAYLKDKVSGGNKSGLSEGIRLGVYASGAFVVLASALTGVAYLFATMIKMAREEEVHLYGEEISVDATEKPEDELEGLDDDEDDGDDDDDDYDGDDDGGAGFEDDGDDDFDDDDDLEDFAKPRNPTPGGGNGGRGGGSGYSPESSSDSTPPKGGNKAAEDGDDLLGM